MNLFIVCLIVFTTMAYLADGSIPRTRYNCYDLTCREWISKGKTLQNFTAKTKRFLSFQPNEYIKIVSKPEDEEGLYWLGKIGENIGFLSRHMVREDIIRLNRLKFKFLFNKHMVEDEEGEDIVAQIENKDYSDGGKGETVKEELEKGTLWDTVKGLLQWVPAIIAGFAIIHASFFMRKEEEKGLVDKIDGRLQNEKIQSLENEIKLLKNEKKTTEKERDALLAKLIKERSTPSN